MKRLLALCAAVLLLPACANTGYVKNTQLDNYWHGPDKKQMVIKGESHQMANTFNLTINDQTVIDGNYAALSTTTEFTGSYEGLPVEVTCQFAMVNGEMKCVVHVDEGYATTLRFDGTGLIGW